MLAPRQADSALPTLRYHKLKAWDANGKNVPGEMRAEAGHIVLALDDRQAQYPITIDPSVSQQAYLKAPVPMWQTFFGVCVVIDGNTLVVGVMQDTGDRGAAYVFTRSGSTWGLQQRLVALNADVGDTFGYRLAISGDTVVAGAVGESGNGSDPTDNSLHQSGAAYVFTRSGSAWPQSAYLKASNAGAGDGFGGSVAISGDTVVVGADREAGNGSDPTNNSMIDSGAAYVFTRSGSAWTQSAYLKASNAGAGDHFGISVAISGNTLVVGAIGEASNSSGPANNSLVFSGAAYVFTRSGSTWTQSAYLKASNADENDVFGSAVAISGDTVVVGAPGEDGNGSGRGDNSLAYAGAAYVFLITPDGAGTAPVLSGSPGPATVNTAYSFIPTLGPAG